VKINIGPSFCTVEGTNAELSWLSGVLTFKVPGAQYSTLYKRHQWDGKKRFLNFKERAFPIGLLSYVLKADKANQIIINDTREFPKVNDESFALNTIILRDYQIDAVKACLKYKNCLVEVATNGGKTAIFSCLIKKLYPTPILVLTHRKELLDQTVKFIERYTGLECGFITSTDLLIKPITVAMITTLVNRIDVDQEVTDFFKSLKCVIHDEVHHAEAKQFSTVLAACPAPYRWGFSGTVPPEKDFKGVLVRQFLGDVVFKISNKELIDREVSAKPKVYLCEIDVTASVKGVFALAKDEVATEIADVKKMFAAGQIEEKVYDAKIAKISSPRHLMKKVYDFTIKKGIVGNDERNNRVIDIINKNANKSVLVVVDYLEHGRLMEQLLRKNKIDATFISGDLIEAKVRKLALLDFKNGKLKVLVSTCIIDEGIDIDKIELLILLAGKKSRRQLLQRFGRCLRKKEGENVVSVFDFVDIGNKYLLGHSRERLAIYKHEQFDLDFV